MRVDQNPFEDGPPVDAPALGLFTIDGLSEAVSAYVDNVGVLNLECKTDTDCAAALGYFHARDRFVQMDFRRRVTTGRISQILSSFASSLAQPVDIANRALYSTREGNPAEDALWDAANDETKQVFEAYALGVNAWIGDVKSGSHGAQFPREFQDAILFDYSADRIPEWTAKDSVSTVLALINSLTNSSRFEIAMGQQRASYIERFGADLGERMFRDLYDTTPDIDSPVIPNFGPMASLRPSRASECRASGNPLLSVPTMCSNESWLPDSLSKRMFGEPGRHGGFGSNNWVVAPSKSATGNALFANDPHLGMTNPATWYVAHMDSKTNGSGNLHVSGMTFAGLPSVIIGQNEFLAWGATTTNFDMTDVYVEEVSADGKSVIFKGEEVAIVERPFSVPLADGTSADATLRFVPHHGPILPQANDADPLLSIRWTGNDASTDINFLTGIAGAQNVSEAKDVLKQITTIGQNWVVADREGNIGWFPYNRVPKRPWATSFSPEGQTEAVPWLPLDGRGDFEWDGYYTYDELPQLMNPPEGFVATANNDMTGALSDGDPTNDTFGVFQVNVAPGYRHERIKSQLEANDEHDLRTMEALIGDTFSLIGQQMTPQLLIAAENLTLSARAQKVVDALADWQFECPTGLNGSDAESSPLGSDEALMESSGCAAFHVAIRELNRRTLADEGIRSERGPNVALVKMLRGDTLEAGEIYWDDITTPVMVETKADILAAALDGAGEVLESRLGEDSSKWAWGRMHFLRLRSDVDSASGGLVSTYNESGFANDGGLFTVDVANPTDDYDQVSGASMRLVCEVPSTGPECSIQLPGGQSAHADSPSYLALLDRYLRNVPHQLDMSIRRVALNPRSIHYVLQAPQ